MIAMALVCRPALLIADEPTTALDVTIQAQILQLIQQLQQEFGMAVLLITHDLGVVANMADEVVVMHRGRVMESGAVADIFRDARHPYLKALMRAVPRFNMKPGERLTPIREVQVDAGPPHRHRRAAAHRPRRGRCSRCEPHQALRDAQALVPRRQGERRVPRGRRRELRGRRRANASAWSASRAAARPPPRA